MTPKFSLIVFAAISVLYLTRADGDGHHHHVIIHVPYKIHTIHRTILKHIHHHDKDSGDKYEVLGYTVGKPIDLGHHFHEDAGHEHYHHHHEELAQHDFGGGGGGNELGHGHEISQGHDWAPSYGHQHDFAGGGGGGHHHHVEGLSAPEAGGHHEFAGHHGGFAGYD